MLFLGLMNLKNEAIEIKLLAEFEFIREVFAVNSNILFMEFKKRIPRLLSSIQQGKLILPYPYFFKLSSLHFSNNYQEYTQIPKQGEKGVKLLADINVIMSDVA